MNKNILHTEVQDYITKNINSDIASLLFKKSPFEGVTPQELVQQIESKKKCQNKLHTWYKRREIYYPKKINIEQTSSEVTAAYKSELVSGKNLIDLTGGFGVDSYFFAKKMDQVFYCEIDKNLAEIANHNFNVLNQKNIQSFANNSVDFLKQHDKTFDWIYIDPSRRNETKGKVFQLSDCLPNVPENIELLFNSSSNILIKTSPLLDISIGIQELKFVREIHIIAVENEVKELLWVLEQGATEEAIIITLNFNKSSKQDFDFNLSDEKKATSTFSLPTSYLYEPNTAILKSGAFKLVGANFTLKKLHQHTHLYTSEVLKDFPGRRFKIEHILPYNKKALRVLKNKQINISIRNFPDSVATIRKKFKIKEGGNSYAFFSKNLEDRLCVILCSKIRSSS